MEETSLLNLTPFHALQVSEDGQCVQVLLLNTETIILIFHQKLLEMGQHWLVQIFSGRAVQTLDLVILLLLSAQK